MDWEWSEWTPGTSEGGQHLKQAEWKNKTQQQNLQRNFRCLKSQIYVQEKSKLRMLKKNYF